MKTLTIKSGLFFPRPFILLAYVGLAFGLYSMFENYVFILLVLVSAFIAFAPQITQIDLDKKQIRSALSVLGFGIGKWQSYKNYPYISLLSLNMVEKTYGGRTMKAVSTQEKYFVIYLLDRNHLRKIMVKSQKNREKAIQDLLYYSEKLNLEKVRFNPKLSEKSKRRKRNH